MIEWLPIVVGLALFSAAWTALAWFCIDTCVDWLGEETVSREGSEGSEGARRGNYFSSPASLPLSASREIPAEDKTNITIRFDAGGMIGQLQLTAEYLERLARRVRVQHQLNLRKLINANPRFFL